MYIRNKILSFVFMLVPFVMLAQKENVGIDAPRNIIEALSIKKEGIGTVVIKQPKYIESLIANPYESGKPLLSKDGSVLVTKGYRIQVYNGNLPNSRSEVYFRSNKIKDKFGSLGCYITYRAPFWRLLVGDFLSEDDAKLFVKRIVSEIPEYRKEIYVVPSSVRIVGGNAFIYDKY